MTSLLLLLLLGDLASAAELEFEMPAVSMYAQRSVLTGGSLVVIGAHHFGRDANDAIYKSVANVSWSSVLLVEASPIVAAELKTFVAERNPTPSVPHNKVKVVNAGVCPGGSEGTSEQSTLPFHTLKYADGLAWWQGQIGSFNKQHLYNHFKPLLKSAKPKNRYTWANLEALLTETPVACYTLLGLLRAHGIAKVGMLLLDTEGLDCGILANQEWGSDEWCDRRPTGIVFEFRHCPKEALANASTALSERSGKCRHAGKEHYKRVAANSENEFWALERKREMNAR